MAKDVGGAGSPLGLRAGDPQQDAVGCTVGVDEDVHRASLKIRFVASLDAPLCAGPCGSLGSVAHTGQHGRVRGCQPLAECRWRRSLWGRPPGSESPAGVEGSGMGRLVVAFENVEPCLIFFSAECFIIFLNVSWF